MSGFTTTINGLNSTAKSIDVISNNVANASTIGFKSSEMTFGDQLLKALQSGEGGRISTATNDDNVRRSFANGALRTTTSALDLAIAGNGFFRVVADDTATDAQAVYTRAGQFSSDKSGNIVNSSGLFLTGYLPNATGDGVTGEIGLMRLPDTSMAPKATTTSAMSFFLDSRKPVIPEGKVFNSTDASSYTDLTTQTVFDAAGDQHSLALYFRRTGNDTVNVYAALDGKFFDAAGQATASTTSGGVIKKLTFKDGVSTEAAADKALISLNGSIPGTDTSSKPLAFSLDLANTLMQATPFSVRNSAQNGYSIGALTGIAVDETGTLVGRYSNGETRVGGQIALAMFNSPNGLSATSANSFMQTYSSGKPELSTGGADGYGLVRSSVLEESNIDMAAQLVMLMVQQRNFQANSQSFRTQDELLKNVINLA